VTDSGIGIDPDHLPHLFDRFWKASKGSRSGAGLGLFIVKGIVESHGGTLSVESVPGSGTTFRFTLPGASDAAWRPDSPAVLEA
nr:HAMP domain-containing histidine kinase [Gemmatimonadaceae bacterium]